MESNLTRSCVLHILAVVFVLCISQWLTACSSGGDDSGGTGNNGSGNQNNGPLPSSQIAFTACSSQANDCTQNANGTINSCGPFGSPTYHIINSVRSTAAGAPVSVDYTLHEPTGTPKGIILLINGGSLNMSITGSADGGPVTSGGDRFATFYADHGYRVITMDRPDDFASFNEPPDTVDTKLGLYDEYRVSMLHAVDIASIIQRHNLENLPVFLSGVSRGSISNAANNSLATGVNLSSSLARPDAQRHPVGSSSLPASVFVRPVHMLMHADDTCNNTLPQYQKDLYDLIDNEGIPITGDEVSGGFTDSSETNPCRIRSHHGYLGIETCATGKISDAFDTMLADLETQAPGNSKPMGTDMTVANTTTINLIANDNDGDTLTFSVPYNLTVLGGSISVTTDGVATYTGPTGVTGTTDKFAFSVSDGKGGVGVGVVSITL